MARLLIERGKLTSTAVTNAGMVHLRSLTELRQLNLVQNISISDAGMQALAQLPNLERLYLDNTSVGDAGIEVLVPKQIARPRGEAAGIAFHDGRPSVRSRRRTPVRRAATSPSRPRM